MFQNQIILLNHIGRAFDFEDAIGNWRVSTTRINYPTEKYKFKYNKLIQIPLQENEALDVVDEWDTEAVCKQIIPNSRA